MLKRPIQVFATIVCAGLALAACGQKPEETPAAEPEATAGTATEPPTASLPRTHSSDGAQVFFISPADGATVSNPVKIEFGIEGMSLAKAGDDQPLSGHHHLIVDAGMPDESLPIPADENYIHFGDASSSAELTLAPGTHTLCLLLGDHLHIPHDPPVISEMITITVE